MVFCGYQKDRKLSIPLFLEELVDITEVTLLYPGPRVVRKMARLSAVQTRLWELFELAKYQTGLGAPPAFPEAQQRRAFRPQVAKVGSNSLL